MANIIVRFNKDSSTHNVAPYCDQWEKGQIMEIAGLDLSSPITVTFACSGKAASVTGNVKAIQIPDSLLEIGKDIVATFTANDVDYTIVIPVVPQSKPIPNVPANDLPVVDENDAGKVLTVNNSGKWEAETPAQPTPELPSVDAEDAGKVLTVSDVGAWEAETPSGGGVVYVDADSTVTQDLEQLINDLTASSISGGAKVAGTSAKADYAPFMQNLINALKSGSQTYVVFNTSTTSMVGLVTAYAMFDNIPGGVSSISSNFNYVVDVGGLAVYSVLVNVVFQWVPGVGDNFSVAMFVSCDATAISQ